MVTVILSIIVGGSSGALQTIALTVLMRNAHSPSQTNRSSAAWNILFDAGLGLGAFAAGTG